jgi:ABC-type Fe3+ transport system permease subunit
LRTAGIAAALATAFLFLLGAVVLRSTDRTQTALELLTLLIAWPPIILMLAVIFMRRYHDEIRGFLGRATKVGPGE